MRRLPKNEALPPNVYFDDERSMFRVIAKRDGRWLRSRHFRLLIDAVEWRDTFVRPFTRVCCACGQLIHPQRHGAKRETQRA